MAKGLCWMCYEAWRKRTGEGKKPAQVGKAPVRRIFFKNGILEQEEGSGSIGQEIERIGREIKALEDRYKSLDDLHKKLTDALIGAGRGRTMKTKEEA